MPEGGRNRKRKGVAQVSGCMAGLVREKCFVAAVLSGRRVGKRRVGRSSGRLRRGKTRESVNRGGELPLAGRVICRYHDLRHGRRGQWAWS